MAGLGGTRLRAGSAPCPNKTVAVGFRRVARTAGPDAMRPVGASSVHDGASSGVRGAVAAVRSVGL